MKNSDDTHNVHHIWLVLLFVSSFGQAQHHTKCPQVCNCNCTDKFVNCSHRNFSYVPLDIPSCPKKLLLNNNNLSYLPASAFAKLTELKILDLSYNCIVNMHDNAFNRLIWLQTLNLSRNKITYINERIFQKTKHMQFVYLSDNMLTNIPSIYGNKKPLMMLDLRANNIVNATFPPSYQHLNTIMINLSENNLGRITADDMKYLRAENVETFACSNCNLSFIDSGNIFHRFYRLKSLNLGNNPLSFTQLDELINGLSQNRMLNQLFLDSVINGYGLPSEFFKPLKQINLTSLKLSDARNYGHLASSTFASLQSLQHLDLKRCEFTYIVEDTFRLLNKLQSLYLDFVGLSFVNYPLIGKFFPDSLSTLSLNVNFMFHLQPRAFEDLRYLNYLYLRGCSIYSVSSEAFPIDNKLRSLDLSHNLIFEPTMFNHTTLSRLVHLEKLKLAENDFGLIFRSEPKFLNSLPNLTLLFLRRNRIAFLPTEFFITQKKMKHLDLSENSLTTFGSDLCQHFENPFLLNLSYNKIQIISEKSVINWAFLNVTDLEGNPFSCDCDMTWYIHWVQRNAALAKQNKKSFHNYLCGSPSAYNERKIIDIDIVQLEEVCHPRSRIALYISGASLATVFVISVIVSLCIHFQWYIKWAWYRCHRRNKTSPNDNEQTPLFDTSHDIYVSYHQNEEDWVDQIVAELENQDNILSCDLYQNNVLPPCEQYKNVTLSGEPYTNIIPSSELNHDISQSSEQCQNSDRSSALHQRCVLPCEDNCNDKPVTDNINTSVLSTDLDILARVEQISANCILPCTDYLNNDTSESKTECSTDQYRGTNDDQQSYDCDQSTVGSEQYIVSSDQQNNNHDQNNVYINSVTVSACDEVSKTEVVLARQEETMRSNDRVNRLSFAPTVYYEKRFPPNKSCFEESARTIYTCKFVIVVLSAAYLNSRRLQFEFDLIQSAMRERYGYGALHHIVLITAEPSGELMHLMPHHFKNRLNKSCLFWSKTDNIQQRCFWEQLNCKLNKYYN